MSYVVPNAQVKILHDVPLEKTYEHTLYFGSLSAQSTYFDSKAKYTFDNMSHIRVTTPGRKIRVPVNINNLYDCNYLKITNYSTTVGKTIKTFYCFIDNVEYLNENVSEISYSIDVLQTWLFEYSNNGKLNNMCFIERQHSTTDVSGDNLIPEPVNVGDYVYEQQSFYPTENNWYIVIVTTCSWEEGSLPSVPTSPQFISGTLDTVNILAYSCSPNLSTAQKNNTIMAIKNFLTTVGVFDSTNKVLNIFMCPSEFLPRTGVRYFTPNDVEYGEMYGTYSSKPSMGDIDTSIANSLVASITTNCAPGYNDYAVHNQKLLTYPYCFMEGLTTQGDKIEYKYELFDETFGDGFNLYCNFSANPQIICVPFGYGLSDNISSLYGLEDWSRALVIKDFPKCAFATNDFSAKLVQGAISMALTATGYLVGGAIGANMSGAQPSVDYPAELYDYKEPSAAARAEARDYVRQQERELREYNYERNRNIQSGRRLGTAIAAIGINAIKGGSSPNFGSGNSSLITNTFGFIFREKRIKKEYAKIIDDFFDMYGYAQNKIDYPNINARMEYTYVKTTNCTINGSIPNDDCDKIADIFNNGITYWTSASHIGNYYWASSNRIPQPVNP